MAKRGRPKKGEEKGRCAGAGSESHSPEMEVAGETGDHIAAGASGEAENQTREPPIAKLVANSSLEASNWAPIVADLSGPDGSVAESGNSGSDLPVTRPELEFGAASLPERIIVPPTGKPRSSHLRVEEKHLPSASPHVPFVDPGNPSQFRLNLAGSDQIPANLQPVQLSPEKSEPEMPDGRKPMNWAPVAAGNRRTENGWKLNFTPLLINTTVVQISPEESA